jgi:hypothetical protein
MRQYPFSHQKSKVAAFGAAVSAQEADALQTYSVRLFNAQACSGTRAGGKRNEQIPFLNPRPAARDFFSGIVIAHRGQELPLAVSEIAGYGRRSSERKEFSRQMRGISAATRCHTRSFVRNSGMSLLSRRPAGAFNTNCSGREWSRPNLQ